MKFELRETNCVIEYDVTENEKENLPTYGIKVTYNDVMYEKMDNVFFTREEALNRCEWLVENEVAPEIFRDVMADIMM